MVDTTLKYISALFEKDKTSFFQPTEQFSFVKLSHSMTSTTPLGQFLDQDMENDF